MPSVAEGVSVIEHGGRTFHVVGTAHVSRASAELVERVIEDIRPDSVALELCDARAEAIRDHNKWRETDLFKVIRSGKAYVLMAQLLLASYQKRLADEFDIKPGEEMRRALSVAERLGIPTTNADRDIKVTLRRAWAKAKLISLLRLMATAITSVFDKESTRISESEIESLKEEGELAKVLEKFSASFPGIKEILIDERDRYLATKILRSPGKNVVAVVGAAHVPGIKSYFGNEADLEALEIVPPAPLSLRALLYSVPAIIIGLLLYGVLTLNTEASMEMVGWWIIVSGSIAALGATIAFAHPLTVMAAFLTSPLVVVKAGWVCGLVEALLRKPRVCDFETIGADVTSFRGFRTNRVTKVLLVIALSNLGALIGRVVGGATMATFLH